MPIYSEDTANRKKGDARESKRNALYIPFLHKDYSLYYAEWTDNIPARELNANFPVCLK